MTALLTQRNKKSHSAKTQRWGISTIPSQTLPTSAASSSDALLIDQQQANNGRDNNNSYTTESIDDKPKTMISPRKGN